MTRKITLACSSDARYAFPLAVMLLSAVQKRNPEDELRIIVLDAGMRGWQRAIIRGILRSQVGVSLQFISIHTNAFSAFSIRGHMTVATLYRLLLPELIRDEAKVIYLDCDLVVDADLGALWDLPMDEAPALAVQGFGAPFVSHPYGVPTWQSQGMQPDTPCLNAGVMVMNLCRWRDEGIAQRVVEYLKNRQDNLKLNDQLGINAVLAGDWRKLDPRWNQTHPIFAFESWPDSPFKEEIRRMLPTLLEAPFIIHYTSADKPWHRICCHPLAYRFHSIVAQAISLRLWRRALDVQERVRTGLRRRLRRKTGWRLMNQPRLP